jgi:hypothetical protein
MAERETRGMALRDGIEVAAVTITERAELTARRVPGRENKMGYKPKLVEGPMTIVFDEVFDDGFACELSDLADAAGDPARRRRQRAAGTSRVQLMLALDDGRQALETWVTSPMFGLGPRSRTAFPLTADLDAVRHGDRVDS